MASTAAPLSLPYPVLADAPDGPGAFAALANRIQAILAKDTGWVAVTLASGLLSGDVNIRRVGAVVTVQWRFSKSTTTTDADILFAVVPVDHRPSITIYGAGVVGDPARASRWSYSGAGAELAVLGVTATAGEYHYGTATWVTILPSS